MTTTNLAPLADAVIRFVVAADLVCPFGDTHSIRRPESEGVHGPCRPRATGLAVAIAHSYRIAGDREVPLLRRSTCRCERCRLLSCRFPPIANGPSYHLDVRTILNCSLAGTPKSCEWHPRAVVINNTNDRRCGWGRTRLAFSRIQLCPTCRPAFVTACLGRQRGRPPCPMSVSPRPAMRLSVTTAALRGAPPPTAGAMTLFRALERPWGTITQPMPRHRPTEHALVGLVAADSGET